MDRVRKNQTWIHKNVKTIVLNSYIVNFQSLNTSLFCNAGYNAYYSGCWAQRAEIRSKDWRTMGWHDRNIAKSISGPTLSNSPLTRCERQKEKNKQYRNTKIKIITKMSLTKIPKKSALTKPQRNTPAEAPSTGSATSLTGSSTSLIGSCGCL